MTKARNSIVNVNDTPYYHCMGRCVRRAFICGVDELTGRDYSHRKQWIVDRLAELSNVFLIDVCAYAVMSNHYHVVLKINHDAVNNLTDEEVIERWTSLFSMPLIIQNHLKHDTETDEGEEYEFEKVKEIIAQWRERLADLSWFMRCLNETISRKANEEDKCTGHFWEGRFKSQALLNEQALLSCMAYVDLNPIRAGITDTLEASEFTSIEQRLKAVDSRLLMVDGGKSVDGRELMVDGENQKAESRKIKTVDSRLLMVDSEKSKVKSDEKECKVVNLAEFVGGNDSEGLPYRLMDYLELVDWTGRAILPSKRGCISDKEPKILEKLGLSSDVWLQSVGQFSNHLYSYIGTPEQLKLVCEQSGRKWVAGIKQSRHFYSS